MIYLDNAATTQPDQRVLDRVFSYMQENYGNSESIHQLGRKASAELEQARQEIADYFHCKPKQIIFTSGASESNNAVFARNFAVESVYGYYHHIVTTKMEHKSILNKCKDLEDYLDVSYLYVDKNGLLDFDKVEKFVNKSEWISLVSVQYANNEIGTIQDIKIISDICKATRCSIRLHTDATQAVGSIPIDLRKLDVDYMSFSGHKIHGIQGGGVLYAKDPRTLQPLIFGGGQEFGKRGGTVNVAGAIATAEALKILKSEMQKDNERIKEMRDYFITEVQRRIPCAELNGSLENRIVGNANFCFHGIDGEALLLALDLKGICVSSGSACNAKDIQPSHVLLAIGKTKREANSSVRFSIGKYNTMDEMKYTVNSLVEIIERLIG